MVTRSAFGDGQLGGDLAVCEAPGDEQHDLPLAGSKFAHRFILGRELLLDRGFGLICLLSEDVLSGHFE